MIEKLEDHLREIVTGAAAKVLADADLHVERYWHDRSKRDIKGSRGDQAEAGGLGVDIIPEIVAMAQQIWAYAQAHAASLTDDVVGNALFAAIFHMIHKWKGPPAPPLGKGSLSEEERQAVTEELALRVATILSKREKPSL